MKATKKAVAVATSNVIADWNVNTIVTQWISAAESVRDIFTRIVAHYGEAVVCKAAAGGFNARSVKDKTEEQYKAEASRLGVTVSAVRELHRLQSAIKEKVGTHAWQNAQDTYFGEPEKKAAAPKDEPEDIKALRAEKAEHEQNARVYKAEAKMADARAMLADTDEEKEREKKIAKNARSEARYCEEKAKDCAGEIKAIVEENAGIDAYGTLHAAIKALHDKYATHKDEETSRLAKALLTLL
jgi:hypothetical protein